MPRTKSRSRLSRPVLLTLLVLVLAVVGAGLWFGRQIADADPVAQRMPVGDAAATSAPATGTTATRGATAAGTTAPAAPSSAASSAASSSPAATAPSGPAGAPGRQQVSVSRSYGGWSQADAAVVVGGSVSGVIEDGGTCTLTLTRADLVARATTPAVADASSTSCGGLAVPGDELSSGTWRATIDYASAGSAGQSQPFDVVVP